MEDRRRHRRRDDGDRPPPRLARSMIVVWFIVMAVISTLLLILLDQLHATRVRTAREIERQERLVLEIRAQARLNACLSLKLAKRHGVDTAGLDSPACRVFSNGAVIFPGAEPGSLLGSDPVGQSTPDNGGRKPPGPPGAEPPGPIPSPSLAPQPSPPGPGPPNPPGPSPSCIDLPPLPPALDDVCLPPP